MESLLLHSDYPFYERERSYSHYTPRSASDTTAVLLLNIPNLCK